uniref:Uncharacterized protein n=1 Tax=Arundo donax TaxID=35708 RepID=A0A0A9A842_ARUDO
MNLTATGCSL